MNVTEILDKIQKLPPAPALLPKLLALLTDMQSDPDEIVRYVKLDPSLTAQVLKLSNSAYYGASSKSYDLDEAVGRIGYKELYKLVAMVCGKDMLGDQIPDLFLQKGQLWEYSLATGFVMELLANKLGKDPTTAYTIGLLHSLGKVILSSYDEFDYNKVLDLVEKKNIPLADAEKSAYGLTSTEVAATLLAKWEFDEQISVPIQYQTSPMSAAEPYLPHACMLNISILTVSSLGHNHGKDSWAFCPSEEAVATLSISADDLHRFIVTAHDKLVEIKSLLEQQSQPS